MAESKKPYGKAKKPNRKSASVVPKRKVIDGVVADKSVFLDSPKTQTNLASSDNMNTKKSGDGDPPKGPEEIVKQPPTLLSQITIMVISVIAITMALLSLVLSSVVYWQMAELPDAGRSGTLQSGAVISNSHQIDYDNFNDRLDHLTALIADNAEQNVSLRQDLASVAVPDNVQLRQPFDVLDTSILDDVSSRLVALEAGLSDQNMTALTASQAPPVEMKVIFNEEQIGLLAAAGLLVENLSGRQLGLWVNVLDDVQWPGVAKEDRDIIRAAGEAPIESRANLLSLGRLQLAPMSKVLNKVESGSGLFDYARAQLADLVKLRRIGSSADQPATLLAAFQVAMDHADFDAALSAATIWSSAGLAGLESWVTEAKRRQDLDAAVNRVVAIFVRQASGKN